MTKQIKTGLDTLSDDQIREKLHRLNRANPTPGAARQIEMASRKELISWWKLEGAR